MLSSISIPDSVTSIEDYTFSGCGNLINVSLGNGITTIGVRAFASCISLPSITIPDSVTSIGGSAFAFCSSLTTAILGKNVTSIDNEIFDYCPSLKYLIFDGPPPTIGGPTYYQDRPYYLEVQVWPGYLNALGGRQAKWNGFPAVARESIPSNTIPEITSLKIIGTTAIIHFSGKANTVHHCFHSPNLQLPINHPTTPELIRTNSNGTTSFAIDLPAEKGFFSISQTP